MPLLFEREEKLGAVGVFPRAGVYRAAAQADDDGQMLDADRALELAGAAGGALEGGFHGEVVCGGIVGRSVAGRVAKLVQQRRFARRAEGVEVRPHAEDDFLRVEDFAGVGGGAVLGAAAALDAAVGFERDELRDVLAGDEAEVFVADQWRDRGEAVAFEEDSERAEDEVQVLGVRDQRQEDQQREGVRPPEEL